MRVPRRRIIHLVSFVAAREGKRFGEVDVAVVCDREIAALNRKWLGVAGVTDVISFDLSDEHSPGICAEVVVCADEAVRQARRRRTGPQRELLLYVLHGLLHLLDYDDTNPPAVERMHTRQEELLDEFLRAYRS